MGTRWLASWGVLVAMLSGCALIAEQGADGTAGETAAAEVPARPQSSRLPRPLGAQRVTVVRIVDGDTLRVAVLPDAGAPDTGTPVTVPGETVVRLLEIDTPETNGTDTDDCYAAQSTRELARLLPVGSTAWVQQDRVLLDRYDRTLLYVWNAQDEFVNEAMVEGGFASAVLFPPNDLHIERLRAAERRARGEGAGLWSACPLAR